jgi:hypothetical protein
MGNSYLWPSPNLRGKISTKSADLTIAARHALIVAKVQMTVFSRMPSVTEGRS